MGNSTKQSFETATLRIIYRPDVLPDTQPTVSEHCMVSTTGYFKHASICYVPLGHVQAGCRIERYEEREVPGSYSQHHQSTPFHSRPTLSPAKHHINYTSRQFHNRQVLLTVPPPTNPTTFVLMAVLQMNLGQPVLFFLHVPATGMIIS